MNKIIECPCLSNQEYKDCCKPFHSESVSPITAEQLMRSRYSAYSLRLVDYLVKTTHKDKLKVSYRKKLVATIHTLEWKELKILRTSLGGEMDNSGKVEFAATYIESNEEHTMIEHSRFRKYKGEWFYYDGKG